MRRIFWKASLAGAALVVTTGLCGRTNGPRTNAAAADAPGAHDGNDEAHEPDDGSLHQHDAGQRRACRAGKEGLNSAIVAPGSVFSRFEPHKENHA